MIRFHLLKQLDRVASRYRQLRLWQLLAAVWLVAALVGLAFWALKPPAANPLPLLCLMTVVWAAAVAFFAMRSARSYPWVAHRVEAAFPELRTCLLAAVEQQPDLPNGRFGYLQSRVIHQALDHARKHSWAEVVSPQQLTLAATANILCFSLFAASVAALALNIALPGMGNASALPPFAASGELVVTIEPGNTEVERGTSLLVLARVHGPIPAESTLIYQTDGGDETRTAMSASLNDPVFGGRIAVIEEPLRYQVEIGGQTTPEYRVTVFEFPRLERADAHLTFPSYTGQDPRIVQDVRTVSVVEGTKLTLRCFLNKAVELATLVDTTKNSNSEPITLAASAEEPAVYETSIVCEESRRLRLDLVDDAGRKNVKPYDFKINVLRNQPPNLKAVFPAKDLEVSALEELDVKASVWDDFGVAKLGLTYSLGDAEPVDVVLAENAAARQKHEIGHVVRLEELHAEPDQLLSYHWWAEDIGPDGQPRRVFSDMYFAEVRPFEEIFRQGEQPAGGEQQQRQQQQNQQGQGQNAQDAQQLAKLQKDIINATWKLIRRETAEKLTDPFSKDAGQVQLSQESARQQASSLGERVQDEQSQEHVEAVLRHMQQAAEQLKSASETPAREPLKPALAAAQAAYQSLLKLRAREHEVVRQQQQQQRGQQSSSQQSSARSQQQNQQLQQLDLKNEENRYETERTAQERQQESAEERENRQVQNRLRELARRQNDVNDRLKELQSALEEARTEQQKEEIRRQLKRLEDEQRQILQDTDELQARMEQPENAERMAEERQQLEETRDQVRRASEALEEQRVTQAAAAGTRAEQQFDNLREEFRRRASNRFNEEMQEMRQSARELDEKEQKIAEQIQQPAEQPSDKPSLREENPREQIAEELTRQRERVSELEQRMRETIERAEETEPILSQRLYETIRNAQDRKLDQVLQSTERSVRQGLQQDARQQEAAAGQAIRQLREGVERAAEGVLGDETESLRRAREELRDLSRELNQEIRRGTGEEQPGDENRPQEGDQRGNGQQREPQQGEQQNREQPGQRGQGQQRPNEDERKPMPGQDEPGEQQQPGQQGERPMRGSQPAQQGERENQPGEREPMEGQQPGQGQRGPQPGQQGEQQPGQQQQPVERQPGQRGQRAERGQQRLNDPMQGGINEGGPTGGDPRNFAPLTGEDFREWSDRLRDVEEMVDDPDLRAEAARIRERAREIRAESKRHSAEPNWELVQQQVAGPLVELRDRVAEELLRRTSKKALVPLDRDPVPPQYSEKTRRYYERLGSGQ
jgi:hypothetical protein